MNTKNIVGILRICLSFIFIWAFLDKLFGLGFSTSPEKAWIVGGSPTTGFLSNTNGIFMEFFNSLAGLAVIDWLFMLGLLFIGLSFLFNKYIKFGAIAGIVMMALMYLAVIPLDNNPIIDDHIIYLIIFLFFWAQEKEGSKEYFKRK